MAKPNQSRLLELLKVKFIVKSLEKSVWMSLLLLKVVSGKALLGKDTVEKLNLLRVGPSNSHKHSQSQVKELLWTLLRILLICFLEWVN